MRNVVRAATQTRTTGAGPLRNTPMTVWSYSARAAEPGHLRAAGDRPAVSPQGASYDELPSRDEVVELHLRFRPLERARVPHDLLVRVAAAVELDVGFGVPFRIGDELVRLPAAQELLRDAALLPDHERCAFRLPDSQGVVHLGRVDLDVDEPDYRHGGLLRLPGQRF